MNSIFDQSMLRNRQYKTPHNLQARMEIHRRFGQNPCPWFQWEFDRLAIRPGETILELGCGPGELWAFNRQQLPENVRIFLCDLSGGMVGSAASALSGLPQFDFMVSDAQFIPLKDQSCDLVTANHMLYHVPEIPKAVREIQRVLKNGGRLVAATNGSTHMQELYDLIRRVVPGYMHINDSAMRFGLETGPAQLRPFFNEVEMKAFEDSLWITEAGPLVAYIGSMWGFADWNEDLEAKFYKLIESEIRSKGGFSIQKSTGILIAR